MQIRQARLEAKLMDPALHEQFQLLHTVSTGLYVVVSLLGLVIVLAGVVGSVNRSTR